MGQILAKIKTLGDAVATPSNNQARLMKFFNWDSSSRNQEENRPEKSNDILSIPVEIRIRILGSISHQDRLNIRLVNKQLCSEIDAYLGPGTLLLNNSMGKKSLKYFSKCHIQSLKVNDHFSIENIQSVLQYPSRLQSFTCSKEAIVEPALISSVLQGCENLLELELDGVIVSRLEPEVGSGGKLLFPLQKLEILKMNSSMHLSALHETRIVAYINELKGRPFDFNAARIFWENQLLLLSQLHAPHLQEASLSLYTCYSEDKEAGERDELLLAEGLHTFLHRHRDIKKFRLHFGSRPTDPIASKSKLQPPLPFACRRKEAEQLQGEDMLQEDPQLLLIPSALEDFEYCSKLSTFLGGPHDGGQDCFEGRVLSLLSSMTRLRQLKFSGSAKPLEWETVMKLLSNNQGTLEHLELEGKLSGRINFQIFTHTKVIRVIRLCNRRKYRHPSMSPPIENFGATTNTALIDNLETLVLQNIGLKGGDVRSLYRLRRLKHFALYRWRTGTGDDDGLDLNCIQTLLRIPTLESLLFPWPRVFSVELDSFVEELDPHSRRSYRELKGYLHPRDARRLGVLQYLCIDDASPTPNPVWTKTEWGFRIRTSFQ